ncbi:MAG: hypothetical protein JSV70_00670 [bacterium]|nr:MAG: hypothetical protein JSV70_00670 [bacterium]
MRLVHISQVLLRLPEAKAKESVARFHNCLAVCIGIFFGLLMGMTALVAILGPRGASEAGQPGMFIVKGLIIGTFIILSVFLFTRGSDSEEEEEEG